jgi:hypothetical protein
MYEVDRRTAMKLALATGSALTVPTIATAQEKAPAADEAAQAALTVSSGSNPVLFWNGVSLDLVALDHSLPPSQARAPGPCATSYALGLVHAAIADAVKFAYAASYDHALAAGTGPAPSNRAAFVGGTAAGVLAYIFSTPAHVQLTELRRQEFFQLLGTPGLSDWQAGLAFANQFTPRWNWQDVRGKTLPPFSTYIPLPRTHNIDPFNSDQGFYGQFWGNQDPLISTGWDIEALEPGDPPKEGSQAYENNLKEVRVKGRLVSVAASGIEARSPDETNIGLYWAYDGPRLIGTPPRLYNQILRAIAVHDGLGVPEMARMFALCNLAMADAGIVAWFSKYKHVIWRPVLGIQNRLDETDSIIDWKPFGAPKTNAAGLGVTAPQPELALEAPDAALTVQFLAGTASTDEAPADTAQSLLGAGSSGMVAEQLGVGQRGAMAEAQEHESRFAFTPNFPAYPSGHATFGSACFNALRMIRDKPGQNADDIGDALRTFISDELTEIPQLPASESRQCAVPERWAKLRALEPAPRSHRTAS